MYPHGGELIKIAREMVKLSQEEIAYSYGIGVNTIWRWENRQTEPSFSETLAILEMLGFSLNELLKAVDYDPNEVNQHAA